MYVCMYVYAKKQRIQSMNLIIVELFTNVKRFGILYHLNNVNM